MGNGSEVCLQLFPGHADPRVGDGQRMVFRVDINGNLQGDMAVKNLFLEETLVPELFQGVRCIGNQLPDKNVPLGVERVDDDIE